MLKKYGLPAIITIIVSAINFYITLPAINPKSSGFWGFLIFAVVVYFVSMGLISKSIQIANFLKGGRNTSQVVFDFKGKPDSKRKKIIKRVVIIVGIVAIVIFGAIFVTSAKVFNASKYQEMLTVNESNFNEDIAELPLSQIPVVDRSTAERLGSRKIGEVVDLVSQFNVSSYYTQINYNNTPVRVSPLEYADIIKWFTNKDAGIPYYVKIDMASQDTELVKLDEGMKYAPCEYFSRDLMRHIRFSYPTLMVDSVSFEIDESGAPYWIVSCYDYTIGILGGYDITSIITVNAVDGAMTHYAVSDVPQWIDCVYKADVVLNQANYWGAYKNGYLNSIVSQKNVVKTTEGYNYLAINDDIWVYT
ncbi:MAG: CvpA family protein, partial [Clostridia bacterium]|nr:CvpA family protein [Clostridia bacterium]